MTDEKEKKPDPIEDVRKGLGLLFRAAKTAVNELPIEKVEASVVSGVKEVGKALENVAQAIDKEVFKKDGAKASASRPPEQQVRVPDVAKEAEKPAEPPPPDESPKV